MNQNEYLLTYDIGSTAVKLILFSRDFRAEFTAEKEVKTYQEDGLQYQKAEDWWDIVKSLTKKMFDKSSIKKDQITAVAATGQMEDCLLLDASG